MAKREPSSQPRTRRSRVPVGDNPAQAADAAVASTTPASTMDADDQRDEISAADTGPSEDEIRLRAYQRYLERGANHGQDFDDWLEAERELRTRK